jgi:hypothetical protein
LKAKGGEAMTIRLLTILLGEIAINKNIGKVAEKPPQ